MKSKLTQSEQIKKLQEGEYKGVDMYLRNIKLYTKTNDEKFYREYDKLMFLIKHSFRRGNYPLIEYALNGLLKIRPNAYEAYEYLALSNREQSKNDQAEQLYKEMLEWGMGDINQEQYELAIEKFSFFVNNITEFYYSYIMRAEAYLKTDRIELAIGDLEKYRNLKMENGVQALLPWIKAYNLDFINDEINLSKTIAQKFYERALIKHKEEDFLGVISDTSKSIELDSEYPLSFCLRGLTKYSQMNYNGALSDFKKTIELSPIISTAFYYSAYSYFYLNNFQKSLYAIKEYITLVPDDPKGYNIRGFIYDSLTRYDDAINDFNKAILMKNDYALPYVNRGWAYMQKGNYEIAIENYQAGLRIDSESLDGNINLAIVYYLKVNLQESKKYLNIAKSIESRLSKGIDGINELEKEGYFWTDKDKDTLKKMFVKLK